MSMMGVINFDSHAVRAMEIHLRVSIVSIFRTTIVTKLKLGNFDLFNIDVRALKLQYYD